MNPVMIVTDSSAYLPPNLVAAHPIRVIPLTLNWDGQTYRDGVEIQATEFYNRLSTSSTLPSTSQIPPGDFENIIKELLVVDYDVLLLPISSGISGSYQSAASVVNNFPPGRVVLLDTKLVSMALSFQVLAAARAAAAGANLTECRQVAQKAYSQIGVYFTVDTLKYLAAGGRINSAKRLLGAALNIKPVGRRWNWRTRPCAHFGFPRPGECNCRRINWNRAGAIFTNRMHSVRDQPGGRFTRRAGYGRYRIPGWCIRKQSNLMIKNLVDRRKHSYRYRSFYDSIHRRRSFSVYR